MNKIYPQLLIPALFFSLGFSCPSDFECTPNAKGVRGGYNLELKLTRGSAEEYSFELLDLASGAVVSKKKVFFGSGESKVVFEGVKPSTYTIYFSSTSCTAKKSLKGTGIVLQ